MPGVRSRDIPTVDCLPAAQSDWSLGALRGWLPGVFYPSQRPGVSPPANPRRGAGPGSGVRPCQSAYRTRCGGKLCLDPSFGTWSSHLGCTECDRRGWHEANKTSHIVLVDFGDTGWRAQYGVLLGRGGA